MSGGTANSPTGRRRGLTRERIIARALEIGDREGLDAVSTRRLAAELGVTSMALYRHVKDKNDLLAGMLEAAMEDVDPTAGILPGTPWQDRVRRFLRNAAEAQLSRPLLVPLQIAFQGPLTPAVVGPIEDLLGILLDAGFSSEDAVWAVRTTMLLLAGLLLLSGSGSGTPMPEAELEAVRRRTELEVLDLPEDRYPVMRRNARLIAEAFLSQWLDQTIDVLVDGLEAKLRAGPGAQRP